MRARPPAAAGLPPLSTSSTRARARGDHRPVPAVRARRCCRCCTWCSRWRATSRRDGRRVLRREAGPHQGRGRRGRDVLHDVQAHARPASTWSASAPTRCAPCSAATRSTRRSTRTSASATTRRRRARPPARSPSSTPSAWPPATTRRWCTVNYEFYDNQTPDSAVELVDGAARGRAAAPDPRRAADRLPHRRAGARRDLRRRPGRPLADARSVPTLRGVTRGAAASEHGDARSPTSTRSAPSPATSRAPPAMTASSAGTLPARRP